MDSRLEFWALDLHMKIIHNSNNLFLPAFGGFSFEWDARNRLVYAEGAGLYPYWYECGYDVQGRLVYKDAPHGGDYLWDGWRETKVKRLKG